MYGINQYTLKLDLDGNIISRMYTFDYSKSDIILTKEQYETSFAYKKFDVKTNTFYEPLDGFISELDSYKQERVELSKTLLDTWLIENPLFSTAYNPLGEYYTVTQEKQTQLTQMITLATLAAQTGKQFTPTWNSTSNVCEEWTIQELTALTFEITSYVLPRVKKQQLIEVLIRECQTIEEVENIEINYATI